MSVLIDGAYEIIGLFGYQNKETEPPKEVWAKLWCEKARKFGASLD
jgi:hypothetical protein